MKDVTTHRGEATSYVCRPDDDACIFYTSGTTGVPKGAQLTHRGCVNTLTGIAFAFELGRRLAEIERGEPTGELTSPVALITTPLFPSPPATR